MISWLLILSLAANGTGSEEGLSGSAEIDLGRVIPGHYYYYKEFFVNRSGVPLKLSHSSMRCANCPQLLSPMSRLAPGDSTMLNFLRFMRPDIRDSLVANIYLYTDDGQKRGMWIYTLKMKAVGALPVRLINKPIAVGVNPEGYFQGSFDLVSRVRDTIWVRAVGLPPGFRFSPELPAELPPGKPNRLTFTVPAEVINGHGSLTLEFQCDGRNIGRMSLPLGR